MRFDILINTPWRGVMALFGMTARASFVELDEARGRLRVKAGIWFDEELPLSDIASVQSSTWPWYGGYGVKLGPGSDTVSVVGAREGVVEITFARRQRMRVLVPVQRQKLRLSLEQPAEFMRALRASVPSAHPASA